MTLSAGVRLRQDCIHCKGDAHDTDEITVVMPQRSDTGARVEVRNADTADPPQPATGSEGLADDDSDTPGVQIELTAGEDTVIFVVTDDLKMAMRSGILQRTTRSQSTVKTW